MALSLTSLPPNVQQSITTLAYPISYLSFMTVHTTTECTCYPMDMGSYPLLSLPSTPINLLDGFSPETVPAFDACLKVPVEKIPSLFSINCPQVDFAIERDLIIEVCFVLVYFSVHSIYHILSS